MLRLVLLLSLALLAMPAPAEGLRAGELGVIYRLNDPSSTRVAEYYAAQSPAAGSEFDYSLEGRGRRIYESGIPAQSVAACSACHGRRGEGVADFPRLAGQQAPYVRAQLTAFRQNLRSAQVMNTVASTLTADDMEALAAYVQSL